ncbi:MAG: mechanosensitive ion channel domain-containing protein [Gemmatimonadales bacterium]
MRDRLPPWIQDWIGLIVPVSEVVLILLAAWLLQQMGRRLIRRLHAAYRLPAELMIATRRIAAVVIYGAALLLILGRLGVSGTVLWTAITGFTAVAAVAFFAAWSVLSNIFCTMLIYVTRPFRLNDYVELLEASDKVGLRGRVVDINLIYTTLQEPDTGGVAAGSVLQIPNNLFFQRTLRRWRGSDIPSAWIAAHATQSTASTGS